MLCAQECAQPPCGPSFTILTHLSCQIPTWLPSSISFPFPGSIPHCLIHWDTLLSVVLLVAAAAAAKSLQSCPTLCDPINGSPPGFPVPGILQARTVEWVVISFSNAWKWKVKVKLFSHVWLLATPWTFPAKSTGVGCHCLFCQKFRLV